MNIQLEHKKEEDGSDIRYLYWLTIGEKKYSVLDQKSLFETHVDREYAKLFNDWEAIPIVNGELDVDNMVRAKSYEELLDFLTK